MPKRIDKSSRSRGEHFRGQHRFEHWCVDNQIYFITARCRDRVPALLLDEAKRIFLERFEHYTKKYDFIPWVTSVLDNHYHTLGYCTTGANLKEMMQRIHGSTAKLINDLNEAHGVDWSTHAARPASSGSRPGRLVPFWRDTKERVPILVESSVGDSCRGDDRF